MSALQAEEKASHCQCPGLLQQNPQSGRQKGKGWVCLGEAGDSKEETKGKEVVRGVVYMQHWSHWLMGGAEEPNSIWRGQGKCKTDEISGTD